MEEEKDVIPELNLANLDILKYRDKYPKKPKQTNKQKTKEDRR